MKFKLKRVFLSAFTAIFLSISLSSCENTVPMASYEKISNELEETKQKIPKLENSNKELQELVDKAKQWFELSEAEREQKEAEMQLVLQEIERIGKELDKIIGYDTGISYKNLTKRPSKYEDIKVKFSGEVIQVLENENTISIRLAVDGDCNSILLLSYSKEDNLTSSKILENDTITIMGVSKGIYTYESTSGKSVSVPLVYVKEIEQ